MKFTSHAIRVVNGRQKKLESLECNLYKRNREGYTIFAYNNTIAYNGDNIFNDILGAYAYINKEYGRANKYKIDVNNIKWKNRK